MGKELQTLSIASLRREETRTRAAIDAERVRQYAADMEAGDPFPPPIVFHDGKDQWLADGDHRAEAYLQRGLGKIDCDVRKGGKLDAIKYGAAANNKHGKRSTPADREHAARLLLAAHAEAAKTISDREIANLCRIRPARVAEIRGQTAPGAPGKHVGGQARIGKDGKTYPPPKPRPPAPTPANDPPNVYLAIEQALESAATRAQADAAYSKLTAATGRAELGQREAAELTAKYRETIARIDRGDEFGLGDDDDGPSEPTDDDSAPTVINPDPPSTWSGSLEASHLVTKVIHLSKTFRAELADLFKSVDPNFRDEVSKRCEDTLLTTIEAMIDHLPVDARRAEINRSRFQVLTGGK